MSRRHEEYGRVRVYGVVARVLSRAVLGRSMRVSAKEGDEEKLSAYECGFNLFDDARSRFDIRFYLVSIRFRIFDREACYRYLWAVSRGEMTSRGYRTMVDFVLELRVGYVFVWKVGAREWE